MQKILITILIVAVVGLAGVLVWQNWGRIAPECQTENDCYAKPGTQMKCSNGRCVRDYEGESLERNQPAVNNQQNNQLVTCLKDGEQGSYEMQNTVCCEGLKYINDEYFSGNGCTMGRSSIFTCANCGNGVCGLGENKCNCPQDCQ